MSEKESQLNERQKSFVYWYCHPDYAYNATRAYCKAYGLDDIENYNSANASAARLLANVSIMDAIDVESKRRMEKHEDLAQFVLNEWHKMAMLDPTQFLNICGPIVTFKDVSEIPQHLRSCIKSIKTTSNGVEVAFHDKNKALENLARALGMFVDKVQNVNEDYESLVQKVERKRREKKGTENSNDLSD